MSSGTPRARQDFPALAPRGDTPPPAYLDSACMSLTPEPVLRAMDRYYRESPGCAGRSVHHWSETVSTQVREARARFASFFGAPDPQTLVHVRNATEAINIVARGIPWKKGDRVLISDQEHNSNLVIWQHLVEERGIRLEILKLPSDRPFDLDTLQEAVAKGVRLVSLFHASNLDGRTLPAKEIVEVAHDGGAEVLLDGCQAAPHRRLALGPWGVDYYALSFHKLCGPTGTGLLYAAPGHLDRLKPFLLGGETVAWSDYDRHELLTGPSRFEAGLQNYAGIIGARAAVDYLDAQGLEAIAAHDLELQSLVSAELEDLPGLRNLGLPRVEDRSSIVAFVLEGVAPHDTALFLDEGHGVMIRSGMNCVHSWYRARGLDGNARASFYLYTSAEDVQRLVAGLRELRERIPAPATSRAPASVRSPSPKVTSRRAPRPP